MSGRYEKELQIDTLVKQKLSSLPEIITDYYYSLLSAGKSYRTAQTYIDRLDRFIGFTFKHQCPDDFYLNIKSSHINKYISSLRTNTANGKNKKISDSYKTVSWSALNSFFQFLVPEHIQSNPVSHTSRPKMKDNPDVTYLTEAEIIKVLENVQKKANIRMLNRDLCILKIGFAVGLRVSEIVQIDINDLDLKNGKIKITGKGDRDYSVLVGDKLKQQILLWLDDRAKYFSQIESDALFVSQEGNRISARSITDLINKYTDVVDKHVTPHVMRHSCATNLYEKTGDIYLCAGQLHHKNVTTTQRYAELSNEKQKKAANILDNMI
jgi:site-specific recombinase XerD